MKMHLTTVLYVCTSEGEKNVQPYHSSNLGPSDYPAMLYQLKNLATIATVSPANFFFFFFFFFLNLFVLFWPAERLIFILCHAIRCGPGATMSTKCHKGTKMHSHTRA